MDTLEFDDAQRLGRVEPMRARGTGPQSGLEFDDAQRLGRVEPMRAKGTGPQSGLEFDDAQRLGRVEPMRAKGTGPQSGWDARFLTLPTQQKRRVRRAVSSTYLIEAEGSVLVKIGHARNPQQRLAGLQTGQPARLTLLWSQVGDYENDLHRRFAQYRVRGEWFDLTSFGDPIEAVQAAVEAIDRERSPRV